MHLPSGQFPTAIPADLFERAREHEAAVAGKVAPPAGPPPRRGLPFVKLGGVHFTRVTEAGAIAFVLEELDYGRGGAVITPNLDHLRRYAGDLNFRMLVDEADLVLADGTPVVWAARAQGTPLPERVAGSDLILTLSAAAAEAGRSVFLLGGAPGTAEGASTILRQRSPALKVAGAYCPPMGFDKDEAELARIAELLKAARPDIVFVALGSPKQEDLIDRLRRTLPATWWVGVGVSFSFICGHVLRAPKWMRKSGLEWVHRLSQEPGRLFKRYVMQGLPFAAGLFAHVASRRVAGWLGRAADDLVGVMHRNGLEGETLAPVAEATNEGEQPTVVNPLPTASPAWTGGSPLKRLRAVVLLGGQLRPSPLVLAVDRSPLDLPLEDGVTLLNRWQTDTNDLCGFARLDDCPLYVLQGKKQHLPASADAKLAGSLRTHTDASDYRGTGGVLRDLAQGFDDDDWLLVANAAQLLLEPLPVLAAALAHRPCDVSVVGHVDGTPSGLMLIRCAALRKVAAVGFVDMKEQALPAIAAAGFDVRVVACRRPTGLPLRTPDDYLAGLRQYHRGQGRRTGSRRGLPDPLSDDTSSGFALVEPGASVDPSAHLHDAVVLAGGRVEAGAAVVRSLVCAGGVIRRGEHVINRAVPTVSLGGGIRLAAEAQPQPRRNVA